ncbi:MAG: sterol desaturase family protein [Terriglobales bacterium]
MPTHWLQLEIRTYWLTFVATFFAIAIWESWRPRRRLKMPLERRWTRHGLILLLSTLFSTTALRATPVAIALAVSDSRFGLLNKAALPLAVRWTVAVLVLDFTRYAVHWCLHATRLWHVHQVHHSDPDFDVSTGARVHPLEVMVLQGANIATIALLAPPVSAVLFVELASAVQSFFSHANVSLPPSIDRWLHWLFVTPDMHRIHHSAQVAEQSRNFSDVFGFWDHLFGTYLAEPATGHEQMMVGLEECQDESSLGISWMLMRPFRGTGPMVHPRTQ